MSATSALAAATNVAATSDPQRFLHTVAITLMGFGGGVAALILIVIGFKVLVRSGGSRRIAGEGGSGLRDAFQEVGHVLVGLFFITGAFFIVGLITVIVQAVSK